MLLDPTRPVKSVWHGSRLQSMCYSRPMDRIALRELRNNASQVVRRARAGERLIIAVDGIPAAEIGPVPARIGCDHAIQTLAALHLAAMERLPPPLTLLTFDRRQADAASSIGLAVEGATP